MSATVVWFKDLGKTDAATAGGKGANLGELAGAGLPVPPGFVVTAAAFLQAMDEGGVRGELRAVFDDARSHLEDPALAELAERLRSLIRKAGIPRELAETVLDAYRRLGADAPVAVRSSATAEDAADTSFAGMHESFANVVGDAAVLERLVDCWASLYGGIGAHRVLGRVADHALGGVRRAHAPHHRHLSDAGGAASRRALHRDHGALR